MRSSLENQFDAVNVDIESCIKKGQNEVSGFFGSLVGRYTQQLQVVQFEAR